MRRSSYPSVIHLFLAGLGRRIHAALVSFFCGCGAVDAQLGRSLLVERTIHMVLENVPVVMFVAPLAIATFVSDIPNTAERYLTWLLFTTVGLQGIGAGTMPVIFPEVGGAISA